MKNFKKVAAGVIAGAAITAAPLVAFAAPAFADTGSATPVVAIHEGHVQPAFTSKSFPFERRLHFPAKSTTPDTNETHVLVNTASAGSLQGNTVRCGGYGVPPC